LHRVFDGPLRSRDAVTDVLVTARSIYASAVLGIEILSVRPSVRRVLCDEMKEHTADIFDIT